MGVGTAQVALRVVGVVQRPVGDRRAGDGGVEDVRAAQHGQRGEVAPERPPADAHAGQVELGTVGRERVQGVDLVVQHRPGEIAPHRALERRAASRRAPAVDDDDGEALLGEPLAGQVRAAGGDDALGVRAAVGVHEHRQRCPRLVPRRQQQRGAQRPLPGAVQGDPGRQPGRLGERGDRPLDPARRPDGGDRAVGVERLPAHDQRAADQPPAVHTGLRGEAAQPVRGGPGPQRGRDRVVGGAEQRGVPVDVEQGADLQGRRGDRLTVDEQAARGSVVSDPQQGAGRRAGRRAGDDLDPVSVGVLVHEGGGAGGRVDLQHAQRALVARLDHDQQLLGGPHDVRQVLVARGVPRDVDARAVEPDEDERHQRVRRTRCGVGDDRGLPVGVRGVRDVPTADRCVVDPGDEQRPAVRGPPVPAHPVHLLGRDEVGEAVGHRGALGRGEDRCGGLREVVDVQRGAADVGDAGAGRVRPRVDDGAGRVERPGRGAVRGESGDVGASRQREGGDVTCAVRGVRDDPPCLLARPLSPGPLLGRQVVVAAGVEHAGVGDQALLGGDRVQRPEAGDGVGAAAAAQERDARPVGGERHAAGGAQGEAAGPGLAAGEGVRHADSLPRWASSERSGGIQAGVGSFLPARR